MPRFTASAGPVVRAPRAAQAVPMLTVAGLFPCTEMGGAPDGDDVAAGAPDTVAALAVCAARRALSWLSVTQVSPMQIWSWAWNAFANTSAMPLVALASHRVTPAK